MGRRKYVVIILLTWALMAIFAVYLVFESNRMQSAQTQYTTRLVSSGRLLYAENCANCHGPAGQGVVGPPLDRPVYRGTPEKAPESYALLTTTIEDGRPGTTDPTWVRLSNGAFASYTGMSPWGRSNGGPLNRQQVEALATFIMLGQWHNVAEVVPPPTLPRLPNGTLDIEKISALMPRGEGLPLEQVQEAQKLFQTRTCIQCHTIGRVGGQFGPNLTKVGAWSLDQNFLEKWIKNPPKVERRAPEYWSNYGNPTLLTRREPPPPEQAIPLGHTQMPVLALSDQEISTLAAYLSSLK